MTRTDGIGRRITGRRALVAGGRLVALAVPGGIAAAATATPTPTPTPAPSTSAPGYGPGAGRMMGGYGDPEDCPFHDSTQAQQWRAQRDDRAQLSPAERQKLVQQHREQMRDLMREHLADSGS
ncbi:MAG: hypothetical protein ACTHQ3_11970 [Motilibacteraceae bacterium]